MKREPPPYAHPAARAQAFRVVMLPRGISVFTAEQAHVKVVTAYAENASGAQSDPTIGELLALGYVVAEVSPADRPSQLLVDVNARALRGAEDAADPVDPGLRGVNNRARSGLPHFRGPLGGGG